MSVEEGRVRVDVSELTNRRLSHDAAVGSRHSSRCRPVEFEFTIRSKDNDVGARSWQIFLPFLKFCFFFSQVSLFVQPICLNS